MMMKGCLLFVVGMWSQNTYHFIFRGGSGHGCDLTAGPSLLFQRDDIHSFVTIRNPTVHWMMMRSETERERGRKTINEDGELDDR